MKIQFWIILFNIILEVGTPELDVVLQLWSH